MKKLLLAAAIAIGFTVSISLPTQAMAETKKGYYEHIEGLITKIRLDATGRKYFVLKTRNKGLFRVYFTEKIVELIMAVALLCVALLVIN